MKKVINVLLVVGRCVVNKEELKKLEREMGI